MPKSTLMHLLKRAARQAAFEERAEEGPAERADLGPISRRAVLLGGAAATASLFVPFPRPAYAADAKIAIVGAGLAGLTAAYALKEKHQIDADVYEGNSRVGGRCFTARGLFEQNQIAEHGGELIDTEHTTIRQLVKELGLELYDVLAATPAGTLPQYLFNDERYSLELATRDFRPIYGLVQKQAKAIGDFNYRHSTEAARKFDRMTAAEWVAKYVPGGRRSQLGQLMETAFTEENALDADKQSALCVVPTLAENPRDKFNLYYTGSDQRFRIRGGNDQIVTIIANRLGTRLETGTPLVAIRKLPDGRLRLTFAKSNGQFDRTYDRVILAIPFSVMRVAVDFANAGFRQKKVQAIKTRAMGNSCKTQLQFTQREWFNVGCNSEIRVPAVGFNTTWDVTRGQPGTAGILNFFAGGAQAFRAGSMADKELAELLIQESSLLIPGLKPLWNGKMIKNAWLLNPWSYGSYSTYQPGYMTTLLGIEREPEGHCYFAGEHTEAENGFLNSAVESGMRAATQVARSLA